MIFSSLNIEEELIRERVRQEGLVDSANEILEEAVHSDEKILERLKITSAERELDILLDEEDGKRIFSIADIGKIRDSQYYNY
jgi:hypothetical protein